MADLIELRKLRKSRQGIDANKLNVGDAKKKKKKRPREEEGGLQPGGGPQNGSGQGGSGLKEGTGKELGEEE